MLKHIYLILISTFLIGFLTGVYVFFLTRPPIELPNDGDQTEPTRFEIVADMYGGLRPSGHVSPAYRLLGNGTYIFIEGGDPKTSGRFEDSISENRVDELSELLGDTDLGALEDSDFAGTCPIASDGVAYKYEIRYEETSYSFDTCVQDLVNEKLFSVLEDYFEIFRLTHSDG